jgi:hypothetical protein
MKVHRLATDPCGTRYFIQANAMKAALLDQAAAYCQDPSAGGF